MEKNKKIINTVCKAIGLAMGVATVVTIRLGSVDTKAAVTMLAIGLTCLAVSCLNDDSRIDVDDVMA